MKRKSNKSKSNSLQSQYRKELRNLKQRIRTAKKKYNVEVNPKDIIPVHEKIDKQAIQELKDIKRKDILAVSSILDEPHYDYISAVETLIRELPSTITTYEMSYSTPKGKHVGRNRVRVPIHTDLSEYKEQLLSALYDTLNEYDNPSDYDDYLSRVFGDIERKLLPLNYPSDNHEVIIGMIGDAVSLIQGHALSMEQAMMANNYMEYLE